MKSSKTSNTRTSKGKSGYAAIESTLNARSAYASGPSRSTSLWRSTEGSSATDREMSSVVGKPHHMFATIPLTPSLYLHMKLEGFCPGGSIKAKVAEAIIEHAIATGKITPKTKVGESTSGNYGTALARVCARYGLQFVAVVDPNTSADAIKALKAAGADVIIVDTLDQYGGYLNTRIDKLREMERNDPLFYWPNQYANPENPRAHEKTTAPEIADSFEKIDELFIGAGTCGTLTGVGRFFKKHRPETKIVAIDSVGSITFGGPAAKRHIPGLGTTRRPENCDPAVIDALEMVPEGEAIAVCRWLARQHGLLLGGSTGSVIAGALRHQHRTGNDRPMTCVGISPDCGEKYLSTIFNDKWVEERFGHEPILQGAAQELEL